PIVSMTGICVIIGIITSRSRNQLMNVGGALILAAILHNAIGYVLGYWLARAIRMDKITSRTIAIEVGMQNAGLASGLAMSVLQAARSQGAEPTAAPVATPRLSPLKITKVRAILTAPARIRLCVIKVETSEPGLYGVGCATFTQRIRTVATAANEYLAPFLVG